MNECTDETQQCMSGRAIRIDGCTNNVEFFALNNAEI